jgi:hypothetical protein
MPTINSKILCLLFLFLTVGFGNGMAGQASPTQVVKRFCVDYGGPGMDKSARLTTSHFRNNRPKSVWVSDTWRDLKQLAYRRLHQAVSQTKIDKDRAAVILEARIETLAGETRQKEIYYLIRKSHTWLIDELQIVEEDIEISREELRL